MVEILLYNTPGQFGYTPRDIDRRWSVALPLERELRPFQVGSHEKLEDYTRSLLKQYREIKDVVRTWQAKASGESARRNNRFRRPRT